MPPTAARIVDLPVSTLAAGRAAYNPRTISKAARERLRSSLEEFGLVQPLVWNERTSTLVSGHQRLSLLEDSGTLTAPAVLVDLDLEKEKALNVILNSDAYAGAFDREKLDALLRDIEATSADLLKDVHLEDLPQYRAADTDRILERITRETEWQPGDTLPDPAAVAEAVSARIRALDPRVFFSALLLAVPAGRGSVLVLVDPDHRDFVAEIRRAHEAGESPLASLFDGIV
jgi:hypothetical protein